MVRDRKPPRDFARYGTIEAFNVILVPAAALYFAPPGDVVEAAVLAAAAVPTCALLVIGAVYWHALARRLKGDRHLLRRWLPLADKAERPLVALLALAIAACIAGLVLRGLTWAIVAALVLTLLGLLEYVNYYHRQLQHFDNWSDFKKLVTTGRLRPAHSARDLATYRRSKV